MNEVYKQKQQARLEAQIARHDKLAAEDSAAGDEPTQEDLNFRSTMQEELDALTALPSDNGKTSVGGNDSEAREFDELLSNVQLRSYMGSYSKGMSIKGAELELNQHMQANDINEVPLHALLPLEFRATTAAPAGVESNTQPVLSRVFKGGVNDFLGVPITIVQAGQTIFPILSAASDAAYKDKSDDTTPVAATLSKQELKPWRQTIAYEWAREEKYLWSNNALENALRNDMQLALLDAISNALVNGSGVDPQPEGILAAVTATPSTNPSAIASFTTLIDEAIAGIDGQYARTESDVRWLLNAQTYRLARQTYITGTAVSALADIRGSGVAVQASAIMPDTAGDIAKAIRVSDPAGIVLPVWDTFELVVGDTQNKAEIRMDAHLFMNCKILRSGGIAHRKIKVS